MHILMTLKIFVLRGLSDFERFSFRKPKNTDFNTAADKKLCDMIIGDIRKMIL